MEIGNRVRFLSDVGGGIVKGFQGKGIVLVEDEDGFQIPVPVSEVVVVETNDYNIAKVDTLGRKEREQAVKTQNGKVPLLPKEKPAPQAPAPEDPADRPVTFKAKPVERKDGEHLNLNLDFLPVNLTELSKTSFETYLVNDCNFFVAYTYLSRENAVWHLRAQGVAEPNTKVFLEEIDRSQLNDIEHVAVQAIAWKQDKPFAMKPAVTVQPRMDITKFYKLHTFRESLFFDEPVLEHALVVDDRPVRPLQVSPAEVAQAMQEKNETPAPRPHAPEKKKGNPLHDILEVDLHASELLDTTAGMSAGDIKDYQMKVFRETLDAHLKEKGRRIVFIHGKGEGALRAAILAEVKHRYKMCTSQDASFQQYGFGATMVIIH